MGHVRYNAERGYKLMADLSVCHTRKHVSKWLNKSFRFLDRMLPRPGYAILQQGSDLPKDKGILSRYVTANPAVFSLCRHSTVSTQLDRRQLMTTSARLQHLTVTVTHRNDN